MHMSARPNLDQQIDLFLPYISDLPLRDQRETMERPFFSLSKSKRLKPIEYTSPDGKVFVNVYPNKTFGMATIWDADVLIWAASTLSQLKKAGMNDIPRTLHCQPFDILKTIGRATGGRDYRLLRDALGRLQSTTIVTNIRAEKAKTKRRQFSWIESFTDVIDEETQQSRGMSITLADWFYEGVLMDGGVLAIDPVYFTIKGGRERWLYRVARKHAGGAGEEGFAISLPVLFEKSGAEGSYRRFKFEILAIVRENTVPEFAFRLETPADNGEPLVRMVRRDLIGDNIAAMPPPRKRKGKGRGAAEAPGEEKGPMPLFAFLSDETIAKVRRDFPGWDIYALKGEFDAWTAERPGRAPADYQAAFYGFVKAYHERNRHQLSR
ncbi:replication initiator protein A [Sediminicoccus rosea]